MVRTILPPVLDVSIASSPDYIPYDIPIVSDKFFHFGGVEYMAIITSNTNMIYLEVGP